MLDALAEEGIGCIAFSPLAQGLLTAKYLKGVPEGSRAASHKPSFPPDYLNDKILDEVRALNAVAGRRGQTLAQMALAWVLRDARVTSALIGASRPEQLDENVKALANRSFTAEELAEIDLHATDQGINRWAQSSSHR